MFVCLFEIDEALDLSFSLQQVVQQVKVNYWLRVGFVEIVNARAVWMDDNDVASDAWGFFGVKKIDLSNSMWTTSQLRSLRIPKGQHFQDSKDLKIEV